MSMIFKIRSPSQICSNTAALGLGLGLALRMIALLNNFVGKINDPLILLQKHSKERRNEIEILKF